MQPKMNVASLLTFLSLLALFVLSLAERKPFRSLKAPGETVTDYDVVVPLVIHRESSELYPNELLWVLISSESRNFTIKLKLNKSLLPPDFTSRHYGEEGEEIITKGYVNCFYHGEVQGHPKWTAVMSTCHGLQGSFGNVNDKDQQYHLEPCCSNTSARNLQLEQPHAFYLASEYRHKNRSCGSSGHTHGILSQLTGVAHPIGKRVHRQLAESLIVEWIIVNDYRQYQQYNKDITASVLRAIEVANFVDMVYCILDIHVVLVDVITWTTGDQIDTVSDPITLLQNFRDYRSHVETVHDSIMLFTGIDLDGPTVGIAFSTTMCDDRSSVSLSQDDGGAVDSVGIIAAHELGHIFNMDHDNSPRAGCNCQDPSGNCIMAAFSGFPVPAQWSDCSRQDLLDGLDNFYLGRCLTNEPTQTLGEPVCGNGIREEDEMCDCGTLQECTDPCCNPNTCQLANGAECSAGPCCQSNCRFISYGTTCRAATGECDIAEYCPGDSSDCPEDTSLQDGTACNSNAGYCFSGFCRTYDEQCQLAFGSDSGKGFDECFRDYNTRGDQFGNCGYNITTFVACSTSDVFCGQLHCVPGDFQPSLSFSATILTVGVFLSNGTAGECRSFTSYPGSDFMSPGLVQDGTKCGDGRLCYGQKCIPFTQLMIQTCTVGSNGVICSGNGQCNNRGQCSCSVGYTGSNCEAEVGGIDRGGSEHSTTTTPSGMTNTMQGSEEITSTANTVATPGPGRSSSNSGAVIGGVIAAISATTIAVGSMIIFGIILFLMCELRRKHYRSTPTVRYVGTASGVALGQAVPTSGQQWMTQTGSSC